MSRFVKPLRPSRTLAAIVAALTAVPLTAGLVPAGAQTSVAPLERAGADGARNGKDAARSAPAPETKRVAARSGSGHIKCWQYGRLVYESSNVAPPERKAQTVRGANGSSLQLYDMTSAFCVLEHSDR